MKGAHSWEMRDPSNECDVICMAVGLTPTCELLWQAGCEMRYVPELAGHVAVRDRSMRTSCPDIWIAGDAAGIEEASTAMVEGRIAGLASAHSLGHVDEEVFEEKLKGYWRRLDALRGGEAGSKARSGISKIMIETWEGRGVEVR